MTKSLLSVGCIALLATSAQAALVAGDLSIIGFRSDATDSVAFVVWTTVNAGESIYFTDSGYFSDGTIRDSEDRMTWTAPTGGIAAGTVIVIGSTDAQANGSANIGTVTGRLNGLSASGDQIFVGTSAFPGAGDTSMPGSNYSGMLLFGLDFSGATGWATTATSSNDSSLPAVLNSLGLNIGFGDVDNGQFTAVRTGMTITQYKAAIVNPANWTTNDDGAAFGSLSTTTFSIVPEPAAALLGSVGLLGLLRRRRVG